MGLKVIGAGLPRTGTLSMKHALEQLGFGRCYHMEEIFAEPARSEAWASYFTGGPVDWDEVFDAYGAAVDAPAFIAWRQLIAHYPDAKVVLTVRDADSWFASMSKTILAEGYIDRLMASPIGPMLGPMMGAMMAIAGGPPPPADAPPGPPPRDLLLALRTAHDAAVQSEIPADRLLVYRVGEGWERLCRFLDVEVPPASFPHMNDTESFHENFPAPTAMA
jgi:hypothetical protein